MSFSSTPLEKTARGSSGTAVFVQDQTTPLLTVPFLMLRASVALAADTVIGSRTIDLVAGHGTVYGDVIELAVTGSTEFMQAEVVDPLGVAANGDLVPGDTVTLDQPVNRVYTATGTLAQRSTNNMLVDGSSTPQVFSVSPLPGQIGDMVRIIIEMRSSNSQDFTTFGGVAALVNGCVLRVKLADGTFHNLFNFKSNSDFIEQGFDYDFTVSTGNSIRGFISRVTWGGQSKHGAVIRLDGTFGEELQLIVQDKLDGTANTRFHLIAQGHEVQG